MVIGYIFSRKDNKELPIIRAGPCESDFDNKIYLFLKDCFERKFLNKRG